MLSSHYRLRLLSADCCAFEKAQVRSDTAKGRCTEKPKKTVRFCLDVQRKSPSDQESTGGSSSPERVEDPRPFQPFESRFLNRMLKWKAEWIYRRENPTSRQGSLFDDIVERNLFLKVASSCHLHHASIHEPWDVALLEKKSPRSSSNMIELTCLANSANKVLRRGSLMVFRCSPDLVHRVAYITSPYPHHCKIDSYFTLLTIQDDEFPVSTEVSFEFFHLFSFDEDFCQSLVNATTISQLQILFKR